MAWPPPVLPINRTNADPQQDTHPNDHNALALGLNDTVAKLASILDPWRPGETVQATMPPFGLTGGVQDIPLQNVIGNLATYIVYNGVPAFQFNRACVIVGVLDVQAGAPLAAGALLFSTIYSGLYTAVEIMPTTVGNTAQAQIPIVSNIPAGQVIFWQVTGQVTAQSFGGGLVRIWEAGTIGNSVR